MIRGNKMEIFQNRGTPIAGWFVSWKIPLKWMMTRGTPRYGNPHMGVGVDCQFKGKRWPFHREIVAIYILEKVGYGHIFVGENEDEPLD